MRWRSISIHLLLEPQITAKNSEIVIEKLLDNIRAIWFCKNFSCGESQSHSFIVENPNQYDWIFTDIYLHEIIVDFVKLNIYNSVYSHYNLEDVASTK